MSFEVVLVDAKTSEYKLKLLSASQYGFNVQEVLTPKKRIVRISNVPDASATWKTGPVQGTHILRNYLYHGMHKTMGITMGITPVLYNMITHQSIALTDDPDLSMNAIELDIINYCLDYDDRKDLLEALKIPQKEIVSETSIKPNVNS